MTAVHRRPGGPAILIRVGNEAAVGMLALLDDNALQEQAGALACRSQGQQERPAGAPLISAGIQVGNAPTVLGMEYAKKQKQSVNLCLPLRPA